MREIANAISDGKMREFSKDFGAFSASLPRRFLNWRSQVSILPRVMSRKLRRLLE
jgi:hypothetical protein